MQTSLLSLKLTVLKKEQKSKSVGQFTFLSVALTSRQVGFKTANIKAIPRLWF